MTPLLSGLRRLIASGTLLGLLALILPAVSAQGLKDPILLLRPHCPSDVSCPAFTVKDEQTLTTGDMKVGDILDIDLAISVPDTPRQPLLIHGWLQYDNKLLQARSIDFTDLMSAPLPDEQSIDDNAGLVKMGGTLRTDFKGEKAVARITFRVLSALSAPVISFVNFKLDGSGQTAINASLNDQVFALLKVEPAKLQVTVAIPATSSTSFTPASSVASSASPVPVSSVSSAASSSLAQVSSSASQASTAPVSSSSSSAVAAVASSSSSQPFHGSPEQPVELAGVNSAFSLLQVQNVAITTKDSSIYVGWQPLRSNELEGYNVYYSTISGKYMQRRSVDASNSSLIIRDLEPGTQYFAAIRAYNAQNQETSFSQEVAVIVGQPETSTMPLNQNIAMPNPYKPPVRKNPIGSHSGTTIRGETGLGTWVSLIIFASAAIGTMLAWRRQQLLIPSHAN